MVEGLRVSIDGVAQVVLDMAPASLRVVSEAMPKPRSVELSVESERDTRPLAFTCEAELVRATAWEAVYAYVAPVRHWPRVLAAFDTFTDLALPELDV